MPKFKTAVAALAASTVMTGAVAALTASSSASATPSGSFIAGHCGGWNCGNGHGKSRHKNKIKVWLHNNNHQHQNQAEKQDQDQDQDQDQFDHEQDGKDDVKVVRDGKDDLGIDPAVLACLRLPPGQIRVCIDDLIPPIT
ncbi:hypothetical protein [Nonomuraea sp. NPDC049480]|uniref:hypothetical protein n=1 Tax=Nonomuraea sp. NPDC049480 TaxID=3364353 RepID=UPI00379575B0